MNSEEKGKLLINPVGDHYLSVDRWQVVHFRLIRPENIKNMKGIHGFEIPFLYFEKYEQAEEFALGLKAKHPELNPRIRMIGRATPICDTAICTEKAIDVVLEADGALKNIKAIDQTKKEQEMEELRSRIENLKEEHRKNKEHNEKLREGMEPKSDESIDEYCEQRFKAYNIRTLMFEKKEELNKFGDILQKTEERIEDLERKNPNYIDEYQEAVYRRWQETGIIDKKVTFEEALKNITF